MPTLDAIKSKLIEHLRERGEPMLVNDIMEFLIVGGYADEFNVITKRRSLMRKISGDPDFIFDGQTNNRTIAFNPQNIEVEHEQQAASQTLHMILKKVIIKGHLTSFQNSDMDEDTALLGFQLLEEDGVVQRISSDSYSLTPKCFIGYDPKNKRSTALNLPHRTWESVDETISLLYSWQHRDHSAARDTNHHEPMLDLLLKRGPPFNKSEVIEIAIEHLRCSLQRRFQGVR